jgi:hypothetical protein
MTPTTIEQWRPVFGYEGSYEVSSHGRVRSLSRQTWDGRCWRKIKGQNIKIMRQRNGYLTVNLRKNGTSKTRTVHSLVLEAFVGPPQSNQQCRHLDGTRTNNCLSNLVWGSVKQNVEDRKKHGTFLRGEKMPAAKLNEDQVRAIRNDPRVDRLIAEDYGVSRRLISNIKTRTGWQHVV